MHLEHLYGVLSGEKVMSNPIDGVTTVCATYASLSKFYICYKVYYLTDNPWMFEEMKTVIGLTI